MSRSFTVVKASYTKSGADAKATVRYMQHRANESGERETRQLFGRDGELSRAEAYERLDAAKAHNPDTYYYRLTFNPGAGRADLSEEARQAWTHDLVQRMEQRGVEVREWVGVSHTDQGRHDHVHVLAATSRTLQKDDLADLRTYGREAYEQQRGLEHERGLYHDDTARDLARVHQHERSYEQDQQDRARSRDLGFDY